MHQRLSQGLSSANAITSAIDDIREGLEAIRGMESPFEAAMLSEYSKTHNLSKALATGKQLEAIQRAEEERKAREAMDAFREDERPAESAVEDTAPTPTPSSQFIRPAAEEEPRQPKLYTFRFEVELTKDQAYELKYFFSQHNIKYYKL